ncbi:MAG: hypothetical protein ACE5RI_10525 [Candidatus Nitrosomaritimum yanchengensis]
MSNNKKNNSNIIALAVVLSFAIGFVIATVAYFAVFCDDCLEANPEPQTKSQVKCKEDSRCIQPPALEGNIEAIGTPIGEEKSRLLQEMVRHPIIQNALKISNAQDSEMSEGIRAQIYFQREKEWTSSLKNTPFMNSVIQNDVSDFLRENLVIESVEFGAVTFGEHILTNQFGPNIAVSIKTDNYDQSQDDWWQQSFRDIDGKPFARECEFDSSAGIFSEDLVINIHDEAGKFIGILNSATPCDVTLKSTEIETKIVPVSLDNITPIGHYKIAYLQEMVKDSTIQNALKVSNHEFSGKNLQDMLQLKQDTPWPTPDLEPNEFQKSILENRASAFLRENLKINTAEYGVIQFPELILTNAKGATISSTDRTYNYIQTDDEWWQVASENDVLVRQCGPDKSINMNSEDIVIKVFDERGEFIGILNAATPCNVVLNKPLFFYGDSN